MSKLLDQILVVDLESTCWEGSPPAGMTSEIIEIGLCVVDVARLERIEVDLVNFTASGGLSLVAGPASV